MAKIGYEIADEQLRRGQIMYEKDGILSLRDLEARRNKAQEAAAKLVSAENKLDNANRELINATIELNSIEAEYLSKIFKIESEIQTANSELFKADEEIAKLNNQYANYSIRSRFWYITAPKEGQIVKVLKSGIGENVKAGEPLVSITALRPRMAVEMYVKPLDLPLMKIGAPVRIILTVGQPLFSPAGPAHLMELLAVAFFGRFRHIFQRPIPSVDSGRPHRTSMAQCHSGRCRSPRLRPSQRRSCLV